MQLSHFALSGVLMAALAACTYNPDTYASGGPVVADGGTNEVRESCTGFISEPCGDCGMLACRDTQDGAQVQCVANEAARPCPGDLVCEVDGVCVEDTPPPECSFQGGSNYRVCGECGWEFCTEEGQWSGVCSPNQDFCDGEAEQCLQAAPGSFECSLVCSTAGHETPCGETTVIPAQVPVGTQWRSRDGCLLPDVCRSCTCVEQGGQAYVDCSLFCSGD